MKFLYKLYLKEYYLKLTIILYYLNIMIFSDHYFYDFFDNLMFKPRFHLSLFTIFHM